MSMNWMQWAVAWLVLTGVLTTRAEPIADQLEKATYAEQTAGDLDGAIKIYEGIIAQEKASRPLVAQAHYRLGLCLAKKGQKDKAVELFRTVQSQYADQKDLVAAAEKQLGKLGVAGSGAGKVERRVVGKLVSAFPEKVDLSTPESACAAYNRASGRMDAKGVVELSWPRGDAKQAEKEMAEFWKKGDPDDIKTYNQAQLDAQILEVLSYGPDLAVVVTLLKFPEGVGRHPYSMRFFGRNKEEWKNLGEDRMPSLEAARLNFEMKKEGALDELKVLKGESLPGPAIQRRKVDKPVSAFPEAVDLSTPESACAAYHRAQARMDAKAVVELSWVKINPKEHERWMEREKQRNPEGFKIYNQALLDAQILEVDQCGDDYAEVIALLKFPEGKGRDPYSARSFGRIDGKWKNMGEDRQPSVEAARRTLETKKSNLLKQFEGIRKEHGGAKSDASGRRALLDPQTQRDVAELENERGAFAGWFRTEAEYDAASPTQQKTMIEGWMKDARSNNSDARARALCALGNVRAKQAVALLIQIARAPGDDNQPRWLAVRALGRTGDLKAMPTLIDLVDHFNWNVRVYAKVSLAELTGVYFGNDKDKWREWYKQQGGALK